MSTNHHELVRGLGPIAAISINVGNIIGTGIFLKARVMTCNVGTPLRVIVVWIAAGLLATQLVGEPITENLVLGLIAVFAGIWIATSEKA